MKKLNQNQKSKIISIRTSCQLCGGLGGIEAELGTYQKCICSKRQSKLIRYYHANIPEKFITMSFNDYVNDEIKPIMSYVRDAEKWLDRGVGLYLYGPNGVGKSFLLAMIAKSICNKDKTAYYCSLEQFLKIILDSQNNEDLKDELEYIKNCDALFVDEIEKVYKPSKELSFAEIIFDDLFRTRSNNKKMVCATSNLSMDKLHGIHGKHLVSLFAENLIPVELKNTDFRLTIAQKLKELLDKENI